MMHRIIPFIALAALLPGVAIAQTATSTTGSQACATIVQAAANGVAARISADDTSINPPQSVTKLSCLQNFFNGVGLDVVTNLLNPSTLLQAVEGQLCQAVNSAWQSTLGSAQCGLTVTGFNMGFGLGLGGGTMCPKLSFGGGGPPIGSVSTGFNTQQGFGLYMNGAPSAPTGYPVVSSGGLY
ncbi:hypothetical protein [Acidisphaera sp. L21]|uniref:hypothetical protein n=1 Tax=Acidisphaera sp. L21 TaxID=1641851 RepID=UPI00131D5357|nr:hypothetical protein [Acidisphaera sp. L21]